MYTPSIELLPRSTWRRQQLKNGTFSAEARAVKPGNMVPSAIQHKRPTPFTPVKWVGKHAEKVYYHALHQLNCQRRLEPVS
jgi:hypothetical protein